jgi:carbamoyl-phosphate synthase small subunit
VLEESVAGTGLEVTHVNNNDKTIEGLKHTKHAAFSVQYHPEAAPGPFDSSYLFDQFIDMIAAFKLDHPQATQQTKMMAAAQLAKASVRKGDLQHAQK